MHAYVAPFHTPFHASPAWLTRCMVPPAIHRPGSAAAAGRPFLLCLRLLRNSVAMQPASVGPALATAQLQTLLPTIVELAVAPSIGGGGKGGGGGAVVAPRAGSVRDAGGGGGQGAAASTPDAGPISVDAASASDAASVDVAAAVAQLASNWCGAPGGAAAVWDACFPSTLHQLATHAEREW